MIGIPYASHPKDAHGNHVWSAIECPCCGQWIDAEKKDAESYSVGSYAAHYDEAHPGAPGLGPDGRAWLLDLVSSDAPVPVPANVHPRRVKGWVATGYLTWADEGTTVVANDRTHMLARCIRRAGK